MSKQKYKKGREIISLEGLLYFLNKDGVVYFNHKVQNKSWILSMQFRSVISFLKNGRIWRVKKIK